MYKKSLLLIAIAIALNADIAVIVSKQNSIENATKQELSNVYLKKTNEIKGNKVAVVNNKEDYDEFKKL